MPHLAWSYRRWFHYWQRCCPSPCQPSYPPLTLTPQRQRQKTLETLLAWLDAEARRLPVLFVVEDLHWVDPSTLELLSLLIDRGDQARLCLVLTCRPEFHPPWAMVAHLTTLTLRRFTAAQITRVATHVAGDKALPSAVLQEVVRKTDGIPLFVEELTKTVLESGLLEEQEDRYTLRGPLPPLAIPATLHDALLARLDRLATAKVIAQLGATIGRTFAYDVVQAVAPLDTATLQGALVQLVEVEVRRAAGPPAQATYTFKHALIQDAAYQSLLKSTRQQYHQRIAQVLAAQFPETAATQPELLAHHYTEAGLAAPAVGYWQRAGQHASDRSAHLEAISHLTTGIELLTTLPETPAAYPASLNHAHRPWRGTARDQRARSARGGARLHAGARVVSAGRRDLTACSGPVWTFSVLFDTATVADGARARGNPAGPDTVYRQPRPRDHRSLCPWDDVVLAWRVAGCPPAPGRRHRPLHARPAPCAGVPHGPRSGGGLPAIAAKTLWLLGYPAQALARIHDALALAHALSHPYSLAYAQCLAAWARSFAAP